MRLLISLIACAAFAQNINVKRVQTIATQAVFEVGISSPLTASDACTIEVSESPTFTPLVIDVDPVLFPGSATCEAGMNKTIIVGKQITAKVSGKEFWRSRALAASTNYHYRITVGAQNTTGTFTTPGVSIGKGYTIPYGVNRDPTPDWSDPAWSYNHPDTGVKVQIGLTGAGGGYTDFPGSALRASGAGWTNPTAVTSGGTGVASIASSTAPLTTRFDAAGWYGGASGGHGDSFVVLYRVTVTIADLRCTTASCNSLPANDRSIGVKLSKDGGLTAATVQRTVAATETATTVTIGAGDVYLNGWKADPRDDPPFDYVEFSRRPVSFNVTSNVGTYTGGGFFLSQLNNGGFFDNGTTETAINSRLNDKQISITTANGSYSGFINSPAAIIERLNAASANVQFGKITVTLRGVNFEPWAASGDLDIHTTCSPVKDAAGGFPCFFGKGIYYMRPVGGTLTRAHLGRAVFNGTGTTHTAACGNLNSGFKWDPIRANTFYCIASENTTNETYLFKGVYDAATCLNADVGLVDDSTVANSCFAITNLTPSGNTVFQQMTAAAGANWTTYRRRMGRLSTFVADMPMDDHVVVETQPQQDRPGWMMVFNVATTPATLVAQRSTFYHHPTRWGAKHGSLGAVGGQTALIASTYTRGGQGGTGGGGPWIMRPVSPTTISSSGSACPSRPGGSPIPVGEWPTGSNCITITVDGQPGDPTPANYATGTVSTVGANVTLTGGSWSGQPTGGQLKIGAALYDLTYTSDTTGTLSPTPGANVTNSAYNLYMEPIGNTAKLGATRGATDSYYQDLAVRDVLRSFDASDPSQCPEEPDYCPNSGVGGEFFRVLTVTPGTGSQLVLELERGYNFGKARRPFTAKTSTPVGLFLTTATCSGNSAENSCAAQVAAWDWQSDAAGTSDTAAYSLVGYQGANHGNWRDGRMVALNDSTATGAVDERYDPPTWPSTGGAGWPARYSIYNARFGYLPGFLSATSQYVGMIAAFNMRMGRGDPNNVDIHSGQADFHAPDAPTSVAMRLFADGRPWNGATDASSGACTRITGDVIRCSAANLPLLRWRVMPTLAHAGPVALRNISGPGSVLDQTSAGRGTMCIVAVANECASGSTVGQVWINAQLSNADLSCRTEPIASGGGDNYKLCILDQPGLVGATLNQIPISGDDFYARGSVLLWRDGLPNLSDPFYNCKGFNNWLFCSAFWFAGNTGKITVAAARPQIVSADPADRWRKLTIPIDGRAGRQAHVRYWYDGQVGCTPYAEQCASDSTGAEGPIFVSEANSNTATYTTCTSGRCDITINVIPDRIVRYKVCDLGGMCGGVHTAAVR